MKKIMKLSLTIVFSLALSACAVTAEQCDPHNVDASLANKFNCTSQGVYAQRVEDKEKILLDEQKANQMFRDVYTAIEAEQALVGQELSDQQKTLDDLNAALTALLAEIKGRTPEDHQIQEQIRSLEKELANFNAQPNAAIMQRQHELQTLRAKVLELESDLGLH
jgi:chromosome segregation ATPase